MVQRLVVACKAVVGPVQSPEENPEGSPKWGDSGMVHSAYLIKESSSFMEPLAFFS